MTARVLAKSVAWLLVLVALAIVLALLVLQTPWAQERVRRLASDQANRFLDARLDIGRLEGSLLGGVTLHDVRLSRGREEIVTIDEVEVAYSLRQFFGDDIRIRALRLVRPRVVIARESDGRWSLAALARPREAAAAATGSRRPVLLQTIEIEDGHVDLRDPVTLGFAHVPTSYRSLDAVLSFTLLSRGWQVDLERLAWDGEAPYLDRAEVSGIITDGPEGWTFEQLDVRTPRSAFVIHGRIDESAGPGVLDLRVDAERVALQEWAGVVTALENIAVEAGFAATLRGPTRELVTDVQLASDSGDVSGTFRVDTAPESGWRLSGNAAVHRLDLSRWLNDPERQSDITGDTTFDLAFLEGVRFPRGAWTFDGAHASFLEYEAANVQAAGTVTATDVVIERATTTAYGANVRVADGAIGIAHPFPFRFRGTANGLDLRRLPERVPIPKAETVLALDFDVTGQFADAFIAGNATFGASRFLDATIAAGAVGHVDTRADPIRYSGEGGIQGLSLERVASAFEIDWLSDPRYQGRVSGHFAVEGTGGGDMLALTSHGRLAEAAIFGGTLTEAAVTLTIEDGSLDASYDGRIDGVNPAIALADDRFEASVTATGRVRIRVDDLLLRSPEIDDYQITADLTLERSTVLDVPIDSAIVQAELAGALVTGSVEATAPAFAGRADGRVPLAGASEASLTYEIGHADLAILGERTGRAMAGVVSTTGRLSGPLSSLAAAGTVSAANVANVPVEAFSVLGVDATYTATIAAADDTPELVSAHFDGDLTFVSVGDEVIDALWGSASYDAGLLTADLVLSGFRGADGVLSGAARVPRDWSSAALSRLSFGLNDAIWQLVPTTPAPVVVWTPGRVTLEPLTFTPAGDPTQRVRIAGTWRGERDGQLDLFAEDVQIASLAAALGQPDSYAGTLDLDATITGTNAQPIVTGNILITSGRVRQLAYEQLFGRVVYVNGMFEIGVRLDQGPGVWLTASGAFPLGLIDRTQPERPMHVAIASTPISLGLIEGLTGVVREVTGQIELDVSAVGTSHDPRFTGLVRLVDAGFVVNATGARYQRGNGTVTLTRDRMSVDALRLYDRTGQPLDVQGSVGTEELRLQDVELDVRARQFEVLRNQYGTVNVDAGLTLSGRIEAPVVAGTVTITQGELRVDRILDRVLFSPYDVEAAPEGPVDALTALNPWERLALDIALDVPNTLRMIGDNVQVAAGTPLGVGNINVRVSGNLFLRKERGGELMVIGGLDEMTGRYAFQGRRFDLDPSSTVAFSGDLDPELLVTVTRIISGVEARVTIAGRLSEPALQLASTPPLDPSDVLSLIVFNTSVNQLSLAQQEQLAVRAGTLAAGFLTAPLVSALERTLGLDVLEIEAAATGTRVTIGDEIAPGLVARFSRQFGADEYDEATIEYFLSRLFRIRATFSDAGSVIRSPFRRVERAGIDLLLFFSF